MSPQRDDVQTLTHIHRDTILVFFGKLFCEQFVLFSILQPEHLHSPTVHMHTHLCSLTPFLKEQNTILSFVIYYCRRSHHFMTLLPLILLPPHMFLFIQTSPFFLPSPPLCIFIQTHLPLFLSISPHFGYRLSLYPCVQLLLPALFP